MKNKATSFQGDLLEKDETLGDLNPFLALMDENDQSASSFMLDIESTDPNSDLVSLQQLQMNLQTNINEFRTSITNFPVMLTSYELSIIQNSTRGVLQATVVMQNEMLILTEGLTTPYNDTLPADVAYPISNTMTSLDHVLYVLQPVDQSIIARQLNKQLMRVIEITGKALATDTSSDLHRSFNTMSAQMMNVLIAALHGLDTQSALNLGHVTESMLQMSVDLMYLMDSENLLDTEALDVMNSLLDDVNSVLLDLSKLTNQPKTGGVDSLLQLENLFNDLDAILVDMTTVIKSSTDYVVWYNDNSTDTVNILYVGEFLYNMNILGLVSFSIAFGVVVGRQGDDGKLVLRFFSATNEAVMTLVGIIMW